MLIVALACSATIAAGLGGVEDGHNRHTVSVQKMRGMQVPAHFDATTQTIRMCAVNFGAAKKYPNLMPFFDDAVKHSGCDSLVHGETDTANLKLRTSDLKLNDAINDVARNFGKYGARGSNWLVPAGITMHMARCGSTAVANMMQAASRTVVIAEPQPIFEALSSEYLAEEDRILVLRLLVHLYVAGATTQARDYWKADGSALHADGKAKGVKGRGDSAAAAKKGWKVVFKMQSNTIWKLDLLRKAFPAPRTRWAFVYRDPVPVIVSLLKHSARVDLVRSPCLRGRARERFPTFLAETAGLKHNVTRDALVGIAYAHDLAIIKERRGDTGVAVVGRESVLAMSAEQYCALHLAELQNNVLREAAGQSVRVGIRMIKHTELPNVVPDSLLAHFGIGAAAELELAKSKGGGSSARIKKLVKKVAQERETILSASQSASKMGGREKWTDDTGRKRREASPAVAYWARKYVSGTMRKLDALHKVQQRKKCGKMGTCKAEAGDSDEDSDEDEDEDEFEASARAKAEEHAVKQAAQAPPSAKQRGMLVHAGDAIASDKDPSQRCLKALGHSGVEDDEIERMPAMQVNSFVAEWGVRFFTAGDMLAAEACWRWSLTQPSTFNNRLNVLENLASLEDVLERRIPGNMRIYHSRAIPENQLPTASSAEAWEKFTPPAERPEVLKMVRGHGVEHPGKDIALQVHKGVLSDELCDYMVEVFERSGSEYIVGNVASPDGYYEINPAVKLDTEVDISDSSSRVWMGIEWALMQAVTSVVHNYEQTNSGFRMYPNPLGYESFRLKRYSADTPTPHHHTWHVDSSSTNSACRALALLFYLNDVEEGGETLFLTPNKQRVRPRRGQVLAFPANANYLHAGAAPISNDKYIVTTFVTFCTIGEPHPVKPLPLDMREELEQFWGEPPSLLKPSKPLPKMQEKRTVAEMMNGFRVAGGASGP